MKNLKVLERYARSNPQSSEWKFFDHFGAVLV